MEASGKAVSVYIVFVYDSFSLNAVCTLGLENGNDNKWKFLTFCVSFKFNSLSFNLGIKLNFFLNKGG